MPFVFVVGVLRIRLARNSCSLLCHSRLAPGMCETCERVRFVMMLVADCFVGFLLLGFLDGCWWGLGISICQSCIIIDARLLAQTYLVACSFYVPVVAS